MIHTDPRATASATGPVLKRVQPLTANAMEKETLTMTKSIQEQCGINTTFPGTQTNSFLAMVATG